MLYPVSVKCPYKLNYKQRWVLKSYDLNWNGCTYSGRINRKKYAKLQTYCKRNRLKLSIENELSTRGVNYRTAFFEKNAPIYKDYYFCSYCGFPLPKSKITVDHLYPIGLAKKDISFQKKLHKKGIYDINDVKNLVPACKKCNKRKGVKTGAWIIKGKIGRHQYLWVVRHILRIALMLSLIILLIYHSKELGEILWTLKLPYLH